jgi:hypothetical protein
VRRRPSFLRSGRTAVGGRGSSRGVEPSYARSSYP